MRFLLSLVIGCACSITLTVLNSLPTLEDTPSSILLSALQSLPAQCLSRIRVHIHDQGHTSHQGERKTVCPRGKSSSGLGCIVPEADEYTLVTHSPSRNPGRREVAVTQVCQVENCTGGPLSATQQYLSNLVMHEHHWRASTNRLFFFF